MLPSSNAPSPITIPQSTASFNRNQRQHHHSALGNINALPPVDEIVTDESIAKSSSGSSSQQRQPANTRGQHPSALGSINKLPQVDEIVTDESIAKSSSGSSSQRRHPGDTRQSIWMEFTDPESGDKYYADKVGNTTWEKPIRGKIIRQDRPKANQALEEQEKQSKSKSKKPLPPGWSAHKSRDTGDKYYMGPNGETQWHRPKGVKVKKSRRSTGRKKKSKLPREWIGLIDHESGEVYYYNQQTGQSTWDRPAI